MPWPPPHRCKCWTWQRPYRPPQRRDLRPHGAGLQRRPLRRRNAPCPGLLRTGARAGPGTGVFGRFNGGTHGYTMRGYNGVLFGESAHRALATDAQTQVSDLAAASSASSAARPTATQCWTTTTSSSAKGRTVPRPPSYRCRCWTWQRPHRLLQRLDLRLHGAGLQRRPLWRRGAQCAGLLRTDAGAGPGNGLIGCFSSRTFGKGARRALASFTQLHRNSRRLHRQVRRRRAQQHHPRQRHAGADAGPGGGIIRGASGGYGHAVLDFNGVFFGKGARRALASFAQVQAPDLAGTCPKHLIQSWATMRCLRGGAPNARSHGGASAACGSARLRTPARRLVAAAARPVATHSFHATGAVRKLAPFRLRRPCRSFRTCRRLSHRRRRR